MFLPICKADLVKRGWDQLDIIIITGDAYVDHHSFGASVIGRVLEAAGFKVGVIAQPDWRCLDDFKKLGRPRLFFGVTSGNLDSMVANYTANRNLRKDDAYSPAGKAGFRPDRALLVYSNRIREAFKDTVIILGGLEASLRRLAHYDYWSDQVRRSVLIDAKADILIYGMGEQQVVLLAQALAAGEKNEQLKNYAGTVVICKDLAALNEYLLIPSFEEVSKDKIKFNQAYRVIYQNQNPYTAKIIVQPHADRFICQNPPVLPLASAELDRIYELNYQRAVHPVYKSLGGVPAFTMIEFSLVSHRGCLGECSFCCLNLHQGSLIQSRSHASIMREVKQLAANPKFKGTITDIGGPTANLYGARCQRVGAKGRCDQRHCLLPKKCANLKLGYQEIIKLWQDVLRVKGIKHVFVSSGVRYDLLLDSSAEVFLKEFCQKHICGQLKIAPEHIADDVLKIMNKPLFHSYQQFIEKFQKTCARVKKPLFLVNYFLSGHPGATLADACALGVYLAKHNIRPQQVQDFIPLPLTLAGCIYYTGYHPLTNQPVYVAGGLKERRMQRAFCQYFLPQNRKYLLEALSLLGKNELKKYFFNAAKKKID